MGRRKPQIPNGFALFDVVYEDGSPRSNRKVPAVELGGLDGDEPARSIIEMQDRKISEMSGMPPARIKTIARARKAADPGSQKATKMRKAD